MKKKIAILLASTMVLGGAFNAMADTVSEPTAAGSEKANGGLKDAGQNNVAGSGSVTAVSTTVYSVVVSTNSKLDFAADPQGLATMSGATSSLSDLESNAGKVYSTSKVTAANKSSKDIVVDFTVTATKASGSDTNVEVKDTAADVEAATAPTVALAVIPSEATLTTDADETEVTGYSVAVDQKTEGYALTDATALKIPVRLKAADYEVKRSGAEGAYTYTYEVKEGDEALGGAVQFALAGVCGGEGWTDGTNTAILPATSVTYSFRDVVKESAEGQKDNDDSVAYEEGSKIAVGCDGSLAAAKTLTGLAVSATAATNANVLASDGSNDIVIYDASIQSGDTVTITPVTTTGSNKAAFTQTDASKATVANGSVTIKAAWISTLKSAATRGTGTYTVKVGNSASYTITLS